MNSPDTFPASAQQVGGSHYKDLRIQPGQFLERHGVPWLAANAIKYLARHASKNGIEDLRKAHHYLRLLREWRRPYTWWERVFGRRGERLHWMECYDFYSQFGRSEGQAIRAILCDHDLVGAETLIRRIARDQYWTDI